MFHLSMRTGTAAFHDQHPATEIAQILRGIAQRLDDNGGTYVAAAERGQMAGANIYDSNGNRIGDWSYHHE